MQNKKSLNEVAILAGGRGTRLNLSDIPKPLAPICNIPILEYLIYLCRENGYKNILLLVQYLSNQIYDYFGDGSKFQVNISYIEEKNPLGTGGAVMNSIDQMEDNFLVLYADTYAEVNLKKMFKFHIDNNSECTIFIHPNDHPIDSDIVECDQNYDVINIFPYPHDDSLLKRNLVNAALYVFNKKTLKRNIYSSSKFDIAKDYLPFLIKKKVRIIGYKSVEYIKDMGTPYRQKKVENDIVSELPLKLSDKVRRKAIFIDRDGTINQDFGHIRSPDQIELIEKSAQAIKSFNNAGFLVIVITNQPVLARGECSFGVLEEIHAKLEIMLGNYGAYLDDILFCPHHPDKGFDGEVSELKKKCLCRKPESGLINLAIKKYNIDLADSWLIGDMTSDIELANRLSIKSILVRSGFAGKDRKFKSEPDYIVDNLFKASKIILYSSE